MCSSEELFSLRIVIADFYMEKPTPGLDACYSEFRGKEIKRVPIIRIFGSNAQGQKTCMHVHGVFPYFYIPYDQKDFESVNQAIYQIAINLDKAINISLSQGSSSSQHVFKVQLVKGIPFYGYHRSEHLFLKIYMFNPRFIRRAANLLQNGAILNKHFHPHESHVPYILQFMIDFNLYGMSFLHVPLEVVKFRCSESSSEIPFKHIHETQILDVNLIKKISCSSLEVDIGSNFILNRFQLIAKINTAHTNPGIESIWHDEHSRRQKLRESAEDNEDKLNAIPPLEIPATQERPDVQITESEVFFRTALLSKLSATESTNLESTQMSNQTLNSSHLSNMTFNVSNANSNKQQKRIFNLSKMLQNFVYPEECTQNNNLINASFIPNHLSNNSLFEQSLTASSNEGKSQAKENNIEDESVFLDNTIVDEELVLSLTQSQCHTKENERQHVPLNATLREEDMELLDILQELEENNEDKIDLDSTLAPLSQNLENFMLSPQALDKKTSAAALQQPKFDSDSEDDAESNKNLHDFSIALENLDDLILKFTQTQTEENASEDKTEIILPQSDGANDLLKTPTKVAKPLSNKSSPRTPPTPKSRRLTLRSPGRSPKACHKYAPLPLVSVNRLDLKSTIVKCTNGITPLKEDPPNRNSLSMMSLRKKLALSDLRRKSISVDTNVADYVTDATNTKSHKRPRKTETLDKTHVTCNLTPLRTHKNSLKVYKVENDDSNRAGNAETSTQTRRNKEQNKFDKAKKKEILSQNNKKNSLNHAINSEEPSSSSETDEEIVESDHEDGKTPILKKLRHSFLAINSAKRNKTSTSETLHSIPAKNSAEIVKANNEKHFTVKKCFVKLKRIERKVQSEAGDAKNKNKMDAENRLSEVQHSKSFIQQMSKEKESYENLLLTTCTNSQRKITNPLNDSQKSFVAQEKLQENYETAKNSIETFPIDNFTDSMAYEVIEDTPPQSSDKSLAAMHSHPKSISLQSPSLFTQTFSPVLFDNSVQKTAGKIRSRTNSLQSEALTLSSDNCFGFFPATELIITPLDLPPSREEVLNGCHKLELPEFEFQQPFYSNPDDITKRKELGFTVLKIPGNKLNDIEEFQSILGADMNGLASWRREQLVRLGGVEMLNKYRNTQRIREYFSNQKSVIITPQFDVPTRQEVKLWLKARQLLKDKGELPQEMETKNLYEDSPIKIKRQKVTLMLNAGKSDHEKSDGDDSLDCSLSSLSLTPLTPATATQQKKVQKSEQNFTPVTRNAGKISLKRDISLRKRNNCRVLRRVSLNKQLKEAFEKEAKSVDEPESAKILANQESKAENSQHSETSVSSQTVLAELERSSFVQQLKLNDVTIGGFTDNSTLNNSFGFKVALENLQQAKADIEFNYLTIITLELFVATREDLYPHPELDEIRCLFYAIENSIPNDNTKLPRKACGYIMVHDHRDVVAKEGRIHGIDSDIDVTIVQTEVEALESLLGLCAHWDPDIYAGYEIEMSSWGYVIERAKFLCLNIAPLLSRVPTQKVRDFVDEDRESFTDLDVEMKLCGRILLDVWRLLRSEIALTSYTFENVMYHILHKRCPWHSYRHLTEWFASPCSRWIVIEYYLERVRGTLAILDQLDLIGRTSEMAKLIGIQFYEVLSRGSQFRVESMMLRIAKPKNLVPISPSVQQRAHMRAPEYLALIMEPQSRFYADPLIVLDFQSLYPSMIIAYNYCFSTCLGRVEHLGQSTPFEFGASQLRVSPSMLRKLLDKDLVTISPCGVVFVKSAVREGMLPRMLTEILDTRQMVKQSMKLHKSNSALQRILHSRQLGLKLMANVTYGYTAANFSGRMPAVEVGDTVVSKGRETLERAIKLVESNDKWNVRVVYGDTDSMFVLVPGRNREEAFRIGEEIAEAVTKQNPHPVKLKLEKVYQPCILQTKKRYVGYMYESSDQKEPVYEAKGIETVRRDGCPLVAKMLEKVLRILFETADVSQVKHYVCRLFTKLLSGRANLQDLIFAKEFRGLNGYRPTACVPALELTRKWIQTDPRRIPRRGERVPFIITNGPPGVPLIRLVRHPHEVLNDEGLKINAVYYITKAIIPPLNRCLLLIGADVNEWFASLPRKILLTPALSMANEIISCPNAKSKKSTISQFFSTTNCIADCGRQTKEGICLNCTENETRSVVILQTKISKIQRSYLTAQNICQACCGRVGDINCGSLDCPVLYVLEVKRRDLQQITHFRNVLEERF